MDMHRLKADFEQGYKYDELAKKYDISKGTISKYKKKYGWKRNKKQNVETKRKQVSNKVSKVKLNDKQPTDDKWKMFCLLYLQSFNATQAYMRTYHCDYDSARMNGSRLLANDNIKKYLRYLKSQQADDLYVTSRDILKQQIKIAFGNIGDYLEVHTVEQPRLGKHGEKEIDADGKPIIDRYNEFVAQDPKKVDWSIVKSAHKGRDGLVLELYDKQKALSELMKYLPDTSQARMDKAKADSLDSDNNTEMNQIDKLLHTIESEDK